MPAEIEHRIVNSNTELRAILKGKDKYLEGFAASYNVLSQDLGGFRERLQTGAFRAALQRGDDVRCLMNHDPNMILGRTKSGTLMLKDQPKGLAFRCLLPDTSIARDCYAMVERGDMNGCSFAFQLGSRSDEEWTAEEDEEGRSIAVRTVKTLKLFDVSAVAFPAYEQGTGVYARNVVLGKVPENISKIIQRARGVEARIDADLDRRLQDSGVTVVDTSQRRRNLLNSTL